MRVAFLGPSGTFSHQAALQITHASDCLVPITTLELVVNDVISKRSDAGILPFQNSTNGHVVAVLDLLRDYINPYFITKEHYLQVHQCLLSTGNLSEIKKVYSHYQAFGQCEAWLATNCPDVKRIYTDSTGRAAELAAADPEGAAIASAIAVNDLPSLKIIQDEIEDRPNNTTRFFLIERQMHNYDTNRCYKTLLCFTSPAQTCGLAKVVALFHSANIELMCVASRPDPAAPEPWKYVHFLECQGHYMDTRISLILNSYHENPASGSIRILGSF